VKSCKYCYSLLTVRLSPLVMNSREIREGKNEKWNKCKVASSARNRLVPTESQNHRMVRTGRDLWGSSSLTAVSKQGHLEQAAQVHASR